MVTKIPLKILESGSWSGLAPKSNNVLLVRYPASQKIIIIRRQILELSAKFVKLFYPAMIKIPLKDPFIRTVSDADQHQNLISCCK